jgi:predicted DNA-binding transcriptional regulator AlpA
MAAAHRGAYLRDRPPHGGETRTVTTRCPRLHADELLDTAAAAKRAGVAVSSWRTYVCRGTAPAPAVKVGEAPAWTAAQIDEWLRGRA